MDSGVIDMDRDFSPHYEASETQSEISDADIAHVNELINNFCEQRGISPWEVSVKILLSSSSSIEGDANLNADLAGQNLQIAQESLQSSLRDIGVNADNLQVTGENLGEASVVDGKVLNETQAMEAMSHDLGMNEDGVNKIIHAYNHGGKISAEQERIMDKYLGDSRGIKMVVELEDVSERDGFTPHVSDGFTPHESNTKIVYTLLDQDQAILNREAVSEDRQQTTEEIYKRKSRKKFWKKNFGGKPFRIGPREIPPEAEIPPALPDEPIQPDITPDKPRDSFVIDVDPKEIDPKGSSSRIEQPDLESGDKLVWEPKNVPDKSKRKRERGIKPDNRPHRGDADVDITDTGYHEDTGGRDTGDVDIVEPPIVEPIDPIIIDPPIVDPDGSHGVDRQQNPNVQATRRRGSDGPFRRINEESDLENWNRVTNKGVRSRSVGEEIKLGRRTGTEAGQIDRTKTRRFVRGKKEEGLKMPILDDENYN